MLCRYETKVVSMCPVEDRTDVYDAIFEADRMIQVEEIIAAIRPWENKEGFQENIAVALARQLGCTVTLIGFHSNVKTTAVAP